MRLRLADAEIAFEDRGSGDALALLHAFPLDHRMWAPQMADLSRKFRVLAPDFRGLGESSGSGTIEDAADNLARLLDHLRIERAVIAGLSMGGYVALAFVRRHTHRLAGLALADSRANADDDAGRSARDQAITRIVRGELAGYLAEFVPRLVTPRNPAALELARAIAGVQAIAGVAGALAALRDRPDATRQLARIRVPTTIIVGAEDTLTPPALARQMASKIPGATLVELAGAGHLSNLEAPGEFGRALEQLLGRAYPAATT